MGSVHVANNAVLTIEPGTVIRGDYDTNGTLTIVKVLKLLLKEHQLILLFLLLIKRHQKENQEIGEE